METQTPLAASVHRARTGDAWTPKAQRASPTASPSPPRLEARWARHQDEVEQAQRLRYRVFAEEMGAQLRVPPGTDPGLDVDRFDAFCEHLLVCTVEPGESSRVVGTYRVLTPAAARRAGGLYSETEFDLSALDSLRPRLAELGRSCTDPDWRSGSVILLLWSALAKFMASNRLDAMMGCASITMHDGGHTAASLWRNLSQQHLAPTHLRVRPLLPLPVEQLDSTLQVQAPPLIKGYLRCGSKLLGEPAWDPDFGVADLPMLMDVQSAGADWLARFGRR